MASCSSIQQHVSDVANGPRGIEAFRADIDTVLDTVTPENTKGIIELGETLVGRLITTVCKEAIGL
jgi:hypothetical protein